MSETSRRKFLAAAGVGAAAGTVAITTGGAAAAATGGTRARPDAARQPVLAVVPDHRSGEVRLLVGEREVVVHDRDLAARILNAAGGD